MNIYPRRLNLNTPNNVRELGGYMRKDKKVTKYKQFLRSDLTTDLCEDDINFLLDYGVEVVIDLRSDEEIKKEPDSFKNIKNIKYVNFPIFEGLPIRDNYKDYVPIEQFYIEILDHSKHVKNVFNFMAEYKDNLILFHCTAGKDRTGITAAIILMLAQIDKYDIIADYEVSSTYFKPFFQKMIEKYPDMPKHIALSKGKYIEKVIDHINHKYNGVEEYLVSKGVCNKNIEILIKKII